MHHCDRRAGFELDDEIPVRYGVKAVRAGHVKTEFTRRLIAVNWVRDAGKSTAAERTYVQAGEARPDSLLVAVEHLEIGQEMVRKQNGLGALQMGIAGHDHIPVPAGELQ